MTKYRSIDHTTTGKSPAELLFNRKIRGKLSELHGNCCLDLETRDRDAEVKAKTKTYADKGANAKPSDITVGDQVLVRQERKATRQRRIAVKQCWKKKADELTSNSK